MNKQEAIEELQDVAQRVFYRTGNRAVHIDKIEEIVNEIDEPQKVTVPKFVAEWIKKHKENRSRLSHALEDVFDDAELSLYIKQQEDDYTEVIAEAWIAYPNIAVEPDKLYTVEIARFASILRPKYLFHSGNGLNGYTERLTETEINKIDERLWLFAKEVEDTEK